MAKLEAIAIAVLYHLAAIFVLALPSSASFIGNNGDFDYFVLSLQWPPTYCRGTLNCCKSNACCLSSGPPQLFTIHGLWCNYNDGSWPSCCGNNDFDENEISTLHRALDAYWPTLSCGSLPTCHGHQGSFYAHEFEKHGTCSASVTGDEYSYFLITLNIYFKYNVTEVLNEAGYTPSNSEKYPLGGVIAAIENAFHTSPLVACSGDAIQEIRLCFYKDFKPRDCSIINRIGNKVNSLSSCPKFVSLPAYVSSEQNTGLLKPAVEAQ